MIGEKGEIYCKFFFDKKEQPKQIKTKSCQASNGMCQRIIGKQK